VNHSSSWEHAKKAPPSTADSEIDGGGFFGMDGCVLFVVIVFIVLVEV
jgi:hypothetical protein